MSNLIGGQPPFFGANNNIAGTFNPDNIFGESFMTGNTLGVLEVGGALTSQTAGSDESDGRADRDVIYGDAWEIAVSGVGGADRLVGGGGADAMYGDAATMSGNGVGGADRLEGGVGDDALGGDTAGPMFGNARGGVDHLFGGSETIYCGATDRTCSRMLAVRLIGLTVARGTTAFSATRPPRCPAVPVGEPTSCSVGPRTTAFSAIAAAICSETPRAGPTCSMAAQGTTTCLATRRCFLAMPSGQPIAFTAREEMISFAATGNARPAMLRAATTGCTAEGETTSSSAMRAAPSQCPAREATIL